MKLKILFLAAVLTLSGCLNLGGIGPGDTVIADVTVFDADTGALITATQAYQFVLGFDNVGFGADFENQLHGVSQDDELTIFAMGPSYDTPVSLPGEFGPLPLVNDINRAQFEAQLGPKTVGEEFRPDGSFYGYRVEAMDDSSITYRALPEDGQEDFIPELGANLVVRLNGDDTMTQFLSPVVSATFTVLPGPDGNTIMGLESGSYMTTGGSLGVVDYLSTPAKPEVIGRNLRYDVKVLFVADGAVEAEVVDGNYGVRSSPVLNGPFDPTAGHDHGSHDHVAAEASHDDGADSHTH